MKRTKNSSPTNAQQAAATVTKREKAIKTTGLLPSGSTVLNCALSDNACGGIGVGKIANIIGDSSAGKTMIAETMLAEIANNPKYDDYLLILDDSEHALEMDIVGLFGTKAAKRVRAPRYDRDNLPVYSDTVEQWYATMLDLIEQGRPFVYCLDSLDTLTDVAEYEQAAELLKASKKVKEGDTDASLAMPGSYGMAKAKLMSQILRTIKAGLARTGSTLVVISQTRSNTNARPGQATKKRSGGMALDFYCTHIVWLTPIRTYKAGKKGMEEIVGREVEAKVTKNKITGKVRTARFDIFYDYGVDDIGSCVDFLEKAGVIDKKGAYLDASCLGYDKIMYRDVLIKAIERDNCLEELRKLVQDAWTEKEDALSLERKPRFS